MPPQYHGQQPPFPQMRHHTPGASPPMPNGVSFQGHPAQAQRAHTPQPAIISRPGSRNDMRRMSAQMAPQPVAPQGPHPGISYMPTPPIYNPPQGQPSLMPPSGSNFAYHPAPSQPYEDRRPSAPPGFSPQPPPHVIPVVSRTEASPQPAPQQLPPHARTHMSPPPPHPERRPHDPLPPALMEPKTVSGERPPQPPLLNTDTAIKKLPARKSHSIFTPIEENRSILSQHLASFAAEPQGSKPDMVSGAIGRAHSIDGTPLIRSRLSSSPPQPQRSGVLGSPGRSRVAAGTSGGEPGFAPPSRSNSLKVGSAGRPRGPRLTVQIPDGGSEAGSATGDSNSPRNAADGSTQGPQRHNSHSSIVLPPPSPSASALLSAGASGPPNPFARPPPQQNVNGDTPVSSLPSRFMNSEFLPSPSSFYPEWNFRGGDNNTLPSPLNFATPVVGSGPSFLREDNAPSASATTGAHAAPATTSTAGASGSAADPKGPTAAKRKSPEFGSNGHAEGQDTEPKRLRVG